MSCFWDAIRRHLRAPDKARLCAGLPTPRRICDGLKRLGATSDLTQVLWQGQRLTAREQAEFRDWLRDYDSARVRAGHDTSCCDPFFCVLVCEFSVRIEHVLHSGARVVYAPAVEPARYTIYMRSSRGHIT